MKINLITAYEIADLSENNRRFSVKKFMDANWPFVVIVCLALLCGKVAFDQTLSVVKTFRDSKYER